jgi:hypothetical protein
MQAQWQLQQFSVLSYRSTIQEHGNNVVKDIDTLAMCFGRFSLQRPPKDSLRRTSFQHVKVDCSSAQLLHIQLVLRDSASKRLLAEKDQIDCRLLRLGRWLCYQAWFQMEA